MHLDSTILTWWDDHNKEMTEEFSWSDHGDIIRKIGPDQKYITFLNSRWEEVKISLLDLDNIWNLNDDEISEMLRIILGISIQSVDWLKKVNILAQKAFIYLKNELLYTDKELRGIWNIHFNNSSEIINFFRNTKLAHWLQKCMLSKIWLLLHEWIGHDVEEKRNKTIDVLENKVVKNLEDLAKESSLWFENVSAIEQFREEWKTTFNGSIYVENLNSQARKINFTVEIREKSLESSISKALREKDYVSQWDIMDLLGIRITTKNKEDKLLLMNRISQLAFKYWEYRIKNKNGIGKLDLETILWESEFFTKNESTRLFIQRLEESFNSLDRRASTALKYSDVKIVPVWDGNKLSFEILFFDEWHINNFGLSHHISFQYKRKIEERIRLEWFILWEWITIIADAMVDKIWSSTKASLWNITPTDLLGQTLIDIYDESLVYRKDYWLKNHSEIKKMQKQELVYELKRVLPLYFATRLIPYKDSKWNTSRRKKYTNKIWIENLSVLEESNTYLS